MMVSWWSPKTSWLKRIPYAAFKRRANAPNHLHNKLNTHLTHLVEHIEATLIEVALAHLAAHVEGLQSDAIINASDGSHLLEIGNMWKDLEAPMELFVCNCFHILAVHRSLSEDCTLSRLVM